MAKNDIEATESEKEGRKRAASDEANKNDDRRPSDFDRPGSKRDKLTAVMFMQREGHLSAPSEAIFAIRTLFMIHVVLIGLENPLKFFPEPQQMPWFAIQITIRTVIILALGIGHSFCSWFLRKPDREQDKPRNQWHLTVILSTVWALHQLSMFLMFVLRPDASYFVRFSCFLHALTTMIMCSLGGIQLRVSLSIWIVNMILWFAWNFVFQLMSISDLTTIEYFPILIAAGGVGFLHQVLKGKSVKLSRQNRNLAVNERKRAETLVDAILPPQVAMQFRTGKKSFATVVQDATVLFLDVYLPEECLTSDQIQAQNEAAAEAETGQQAELAPNSDPDSQFMFLQTLNSLYGAFDDLADELGVLPVERLRDTYMVVSGSNGPDKWQKHDNPARIMVIMAKRILEIVDRFNTLHGYNCKVRIGVNSGPVIATVVGSRDYHFTLLGDNVNIAARMMQNGQAGKIQVTHSTFDRIRALKFGSAAAAATTPELEPLYALSTHHHHDEHIFQLSRPDVHPSAGTVEMAELGCDRGGIPESQIDARSHSHVTPKPDFDEDEIQEPPKLHRTSTTTVNSDSSLFMSSFGASALRPGTGTLPPRVPRSGRGGRDNGGETRIPLNPIEFIAPGSESRITFYPRGSTYFKGKGMMSTYWLDVQENVTSTRETLLSCSEEDAKLDSMHELIAASQLVAENVRLNKASLAFDEHPIHEQGFQTDYGIRNRKMLRNLLGIAFVPVAVAGVLTLLQGKKFPADSHLYTFVGLGYIVLWGSWVLLLSLKVMSRFATQVTCFLFMVLDVVLTTLESWLYLTHGRTNIMQNITDACMLIWAVFLFMRLSFPFNLTLPGLLILSDAIIFSIYSPYGFTGAMMRLLIVGGMSACGIEVERYLEAAARYDYLLRTEIQKQQERSNGLVKTLLPPYAASRLVSQRALESPAEEVVDRLKTCTVLQTDIVGFTNMSSSLTPDTVSTVVNRLFSIFDDLVSKHQLCRMYTVGDAYIVVGGVQGTTRHHSKAACNLAMDMINCLEDMNKDNVTLGLPGNVSVRVGVASGTAYGGIVKGKRPTYVLWGDAVVEAEIMEKGADDGNICVAKSTIDEFERSEKGTLEVAPTRGTGPVSRYIREKILSKSRRSSKSRAHRRSRSSVSNPAIGMSVSQSVSPSTATLPLPASASSSPHHPHHSPATSSAAPSPKGSPFRFMSRQESSSSINAASPNLRLHPPLSPATPGSIALAPKSPSNAGIAIGSETFNSNYRTPSMSDILLSTAFRMVPADVFDAHVKAKTEAQAEAAELKLEPKPDHNVEGEGSSSTAIGAPDVEVAPSSLFGVDTPSPSPELPLYPSSPSSPQSPEQLVEWNRDQGNFIMPLRLESRVRVPRRRFTIAEEAGRLANIILSRER